MASVPVLIHGLSGYLGYACCSLVYSVHEWVVGSILVVENTCNLLTCVIVSVSQALILGGCRNAKECYQVPRSGIGHCRGLLISSISRDGVG